MTTVAARGEAAPAPRTWLDRLVAAVPLLSVFFWLSILYAWEAHNHASPWLDVESSLPYEGRVVVRNKQARRVSVRLHSWIPWRELRCEVDGADRTPGRIGQYAVFDDLSPDSVISSAVFPIPRKITRVSEAAWFAVRS